MTRLRTSASVMAFVALAALAPARAQESTLVAEQPSGLVPLEGESAVTVRGIAGKITVWGGAPAGVQFDATAFGTKTPAPVRISSIGGRLVFEAPAEAAARKMELMLVIPAKVSLKIEADASQVLFARSDAACEIAGKDLNVDLSYLEGPVTMNLQGGTLRAQDTSGDIVLRGKGWSGQMGPARGRLGFYGGPGSMEVQALDGPLDADVEKVRLRLVGVEGEARVRAHGGSVDVVESKSGGTFNLFGAPLTLSRSGGSFDVTSDAPVTFTELRADLHVDGDGASLEGTGNSELVEIRTHDAKVTLARIEAAVNVQGSGLTVQLRTIAGDVTIDARASTFELTSIAGKLNMSNDGGDVKLSNVYGDTTLYSRDGAVRVTEHGAALQLTSNGPETTVEWAVLPPGSKSLVENDNGPVSVRLPSSGNGCRVEARTSFGRIESSPRRVVVSSDRTDAQGWVGTDTSTVVRIQAAGDVRLTGGPPEPSGP